MNLKSIKTRNLTSGATMLFVLLSSSSLFAQSNAKDTTMNRTVVVEQQYNPDIMDAQKVNVLPEIREFTTTPNQVEYDRNVTPASVLPGSAMAAYAGEEQQNQAKQGYLRLGYGNIGNVDVESNYLFNLTDKDKLNLSLGLQGWNGKVYLPVGNEKWNSRFYRTKAGIDYSHRFKTVDFNAAGNFGLSNFNYVPMLPVYTDGGRQKLTSGDVRFGVTSFDESYPIRFNLETGLYLYSRSHDEIYESGKTHNETMVRTKGNLNGAIADGQTVGVAFEMNNLFYSDMTYVTDDKHKNYTTLSLNSYYEWKEEDIWKLHTGVNVDLAFGFGKGLRISPDVNAEYIFSDHYVLYANATGGRMLSDFRRLEQISPYGVLRWQYEDSYEQLNTSVGFKMSPLTGLWLNIYGGYQSIKDDLFIGDLHGYYTTFTTTDFFLLMQIENSVTTPRSYFGQANTNNRYAGLQINYNYKDLFNIMASGQYYDWNKDHYLAFHFKPRYTLNFQMGVRPVTNLGINLIYEFAKREKGTLPPWIPTSHNIYMMAPRTYSPIDLNNLSVNATYDLFNGISMYVRFSNLLNKNSAYYALSPIPGINFVGGLIFTF